MGWVRLEIFFSCLGVGGGGRLWLWCCYILSWLRIGYILGVCSVVVDFCVVMNVMSLRNMLLGLITSI